MGYLEEAYALKDECMRRLDEVDKTYRPFQPKGARDGIGVQKQMEIHKYFLTEIQKLKEKYHLTDESELRKLREKYNITDESDIKE